MRFSVLCLLCSWYGINKIANYKTRLLRRLQTQTLPDEALPMGKIHPFSKIAVTLEPVMRFGCPSIFRKKW